MGSGKLPCSSVILYTLIKALVQHDRTPVYKGSLAAFIVDEVHCVTFFIVMLNFVREDYFRREFSSLNSPLSSSWENPVAVFASPTFNLI